MIGRIPILDVEPTVDCGRLSAHATVGRRITIGATVVREGHDAVGADVVFRRADSRPPRGPRGPINRMTAGAIGTDRYHAEVVADSIGPWVFTIEAWSDPLTTWRRGIEAKVAAGQDAAEMANDLADGVRLLGAVAARRGRWQPTPAIAAALAAALTALRDRSLPVGRRVAPALDPLLWEALHADPIRELVTRSQPYRIWVDRELAEFGSWYEFFPRSAGAQITSDGRPVKHGTLAAAAGELPRIAAMGFDIAYLPPIHPIGEVGRKGRNNAVTAEPGDVGSPWAIGSHLGGHDAIDPALGDEADFAAFVHGAAELGMSVALDLALQCAPDHPWVTAHPEWFTTRADGSIAYAENPPKKYQDIFPLNFDNDPKGLRAEILRIVELWISRGVTIFRVDNPHTKPVDFWQWLIAEVRAAHPEVIFLAEAFTRPAMMHTLAKIGFTQSYTYFTWRTGKQEISEYLQELYASAQYMRPNFFVNTPDILHGSLVTGGRAMFAIRAALAATAAPSWGMYSGFELFENVPLRPGSEEYLDSEKYQLRPRDFVTPAERGQSLAPFITRLNEIRRRHPALQHLAGLHLHPIDNDALLCFSKRDQVTGDTILVVLALEARGEFWGHLDLAMPELGLGWDDAFDALDLTDGQRYVLDRHATIRLDPTVKCAHIFEVTRRV